MRILKLCRGFNWRNWPRKYYSWPCLFGVIHLHRGSFNKSLDLLAFCYLIWREGRVLNGYVNLPDPLSECCSVSFYPLVGYVFGERSYKTLVNFNTCPSAVINTIKRDIDRRGRSSASWTWSSIRGLIWNEVAVEGSSDGGDHDVDDDDGGGGGGSGGNWVFVRRHRSEERIDEARTRTTK